ncbi:MAG: XRE family transcriptional regulator [Clostridiales bacterium]|nr:XRE family transcriptional regulator [Clostridiales bacterium]
MGRKSIKENKNVYQLSRENVNLTREKASMELKFISADRIEKIESEKSYPHPDEIVAMAECYKNPSLCNYFCSHECPIGIKSVPEIEVKELSQITLEMVSTLNRLYKDKERLIEIAVDGEITREESREFMEIQKTLEQMSSAIASLKLWVDNTIATGKADKSLFTERK